MEWKELLKVFTGYGIAGAVSFIAIKYAVTAIEKILPSIQDILNITKNISDRVKEIKDSLDNVFAKLNDLESRHSISSLQIIESIYDDKLLSNLTFQKYAEAINAKNTYKVIVQIMEEIDENGLDDENKLHMLKENILTTIKKGYDDMKNDITEAPYNNSKIQEFEHNFNIIFTAFIEDMREELEPITYINLENDNYYSIFKQKIRNKLWGFSTDLNGIIKRVVKKY